jgi:2-polyprenyl-6-methoxyphenol hydroxylase-like FAD-dependent oxidoreductase
LATTPPADIAVHGSGITAHTTALLMADLGLRVQVSAPRLPMATAKHANHANQANNTHNTNNTHNAARDIRAYAINHSSQATLASVGVWPASGQAPWLTPVDHMRVFGDGAGFLSLHGQDAQPVAWMVDVPALEDALAQLLIAHTRITTVAAGAAPLGTLNVLCEGKHSAQRAHLGINTHTTTYPHRALAARLRSAQPHGGIAQQWFDGTSILALLPLGGPQGCELAMVWSMPAQQCDDWIGSLQHAATDTPPAALLQAIAQASRHSFAQLELLGKPVAFGLTLSKTTQWVQPGVALVGDSAHTIHPLAGLGLNMGLADAQALADVLRHRHKAQSVADMRLLRRYQRRRSSDTTRLQLATHGLFQLFTQTWGNSQPLQALRNWGMLAFDAATPLKRWVQSTGMGQVAKTKPPTQSA